MEKFPRPHHPGEILTGHVTTDQFDDYVSDFDLSDEDLKKSILDVGAANASFVTHVREKLGNKNAYGLEYDSSNLPPGTEGVVIGDGLQMPFKDGQFEIVLANAYVPQFHSDRQSIPAVQEMLRVLALDGVLKFGSTTTEKELFNTSEYKARGELDKIEESETRYEDVKEFLNFIGSLDGHGYKVEKDESRTITMRNYAGELVTYPQLSISIKKLQTTPSSTG